MLAVLGGAIAANSAPAFAWGQIYSSPGTPVSAGGLINSSPGTAASASNAFATSQASGYNSTWRIYPNGPLDPLTHAISTTSSGFQSTGTGSYTYNACAAYGEVTTYLGGGVSGCRPACVAGEYQIGNDGVCQGTPGCGGRPQWAWSAATCAGTHPQWTFSACVNGVQTETAYNAWTGAVTGVSTVSCLNGAPGTTSPAPVYRPPAPIVLPPPPPACPAGEQLVTQTTYATQQRCVPTYSTVWQEQAVSVPVTQTVWEAVQVPYTAYRAVPETTYVWNPSATCWTNRYWVGWGWATGTSCVGAWVPQTTWVLQAYTAYRTVYQPVTTTVYQTQWVNRPVVVQTGQSCSWQTVPQTTTSCQPTVTVTTQTQQTAVFSACMPNPVATRYAGQPIAPPTGDQWVAASGARPDTLVPGPGWAIKAVTTTAVTTRCQLVNSAGARSCSSSSSVIGTQYQEVYDPQDCPYPVVMPR